MKNEFLEAVYKRLDHLRFLADIITNNQKDAPEGSLKLFKRNGKIQMYHRKSSDDRNGRYIPQSEYELACRLAKKGYLEKVLTAVEKEIGHLEKYVDDCAGNTFETMYGKLSTPRQEMFVPLVETDEMFVDRWQSQPYIQKSFGDQTQAFETKRGDIVRSKSELIIANELFYAGIPYRYECQTVIGGVAMYPDFTILNVARRKTYFWEHLGKLDDPDYANSTAVKMNTYMAGGYYPGVDLLLTMETSRTPIRSEVVANLISKFLLE